ncbi:MBL fold metallo-hydrolase [Amylibacter sp. SFDW26]|uniref:MBL fold metallo-hydrolase n=1 Tax=Amylibacter sp. SFDW26 TaxID=2652722 RepID=UPI00126220B6|nr:MBL fold metallo-hydrolase [Amylibacter sp. SFDW26]KAB7613490.1 MBL fold metallo-hydrolase [Amylibacter sp. SFDW26]
MTNDASELKFSRRATMVGGAAIAVSPLVAPFAQAHTHENSEDREIIQIADGVYRTREKFTFGLLMDTDDGVVVFDTLNADFSSWLDAQIAQRFDKPVAAVVYSHNHSDHTSGGEVFARHDPKYISSELARESHVRMKVATRPANVTFDEGYTLRLGGQEIHLRYHGPNDGKGSISFLVPDKGLLSVIDWLVIGRLPYRELNRYDMEGTIRSLGELDAMNWELASPGHSITGGKDGLRLFRRYLETLRDLTLEHIVARTPMAQAVANIRSQLAAVSEFHSLAQFDAWVEDNIRGMHFQLARIEGYADGFLPDPEYASAQ